jgi:hypothetical protein
MYDSLCVCDHQYVCLYLPERMRCTRCVAAYLTVLVHMYVYVRGEVAPRGSLPISFSCSLSLHSPSSSSLSLCLVNLNTQSSISLLPHPPTPPLLSPSYPLSSFILLLLLFLPPSSSFSSLQINLIELNEQRESAITARQLAILNEDRRERALRKERRLSKFCHFLSFVLSSVPSFLLPSFLPSLPPSLLPSFSLSFLSRPLLPF